MRFSAENPRLRKAVKRFKKFLSLYPCKRHKKGLTSGVFETDLFVSNIETKLNQLVRRFVKTFFYEPAGFGETSYNYRFPTMLVSLALRKAICYKPF
jgi:hypothetical protein